MGISEGNSNFSFINLGKFDKKEVMLIIHILQKSVKEKNNTVYMDNDKINEILGKSVDRESAVGFLVKFRSLEIQYNTGNNVCGGYNIFPYMEILIDNKILFFINMRVYTFLLEVNMYF